MLTCSPLNRSRSPAASFLKALPAGKHSLEPFISSLVNSFAALSCPVLLCSAMATSQCRASATTTCHSRPPLHTLTPSHPPSSASASFRPVDAAQHSNHRFLTCMGSPLGTATEPCALALASLMSPEHALLAFSIPRPSTCDPTVAARTEPMQAPDDTETAISCSASPVTMAGGAVLHFPALMYSWHQTSLTVSTPSSLLGHIASTQTSLGPSYY